MSESDATQARPEPSAARPLPREPREPEPQLFGGSLWVGVAMLVCMGVISWQPLNSWIDRKLFPATPKPVASWAIGSEADVEITLITPDSKRLNCAHDTAIEGLHCGYTGSKRPWRRAPNAPLDDNDEFVIQPFRTADTNALLLVSGLWAEPELAMRLHREPPTVKDVDKSLRFIAYCHVRFVGELTNVALRWDNNGKWADEPKAFVAKPVHCTLEAPNG